MPAPESPRQISLANDIAEAILKGFDKHYRIFREITRQARFHFLRADWEQARSDAATRINLYDLRVRECIATLRHEFPLEEVQVALWAEVKLRYMGLLYAHRQPELAESFFNSVFVQLFDRHYYSNDNIFVRPSVSTERIQGERPVYRSYYPTRQGWRAALAQLLQDAEIGLPFEDLQRDIRHIVHHLRELDTRPVHLHRHFQLHMLDTIFYRNKAAYLIGRLINGEQVVPFILPVLNTGKGQVMIDALVATPDDVANLFSFARAYFMADTDVPAAVVQFLSNILPSKSRADLYTAIGFHKQGKAEFYRDFLDHLRHSNDLLETAPGIRGMVMLVFTLPSYPYVFKVIRDRFLPPKETTREEVIEKYRFVKQHDRVGRMADTWEFSYAAFPRDRFTPELLDELHREANSLLEFENGSVVIKHLFIERRLTPLNIYLESASEADAELALSEYADAIQEISAAGIFPGDLLFKNFGVTRHKRVIFYDYDEIVPLNDVNFRVIPEPRSPEDELAAEPWYSIGPNDVFPEEFGTFLMTNPAQRKMFHDRHREVLQARHWQEMQHKVRSGGMRNVYPYRREARFNTDQSA